MIPKRFLLISGVAIVLVTVILVVIFSEQRKRSVPKHISAETESFESIVLNWIGNEDASQFNVYRSENKEGPYERVGFSKENEYVDDELQPNKKYHYKITQIVNFRESDYSSRASAVTRPGKPVGLRANAVDFQESLQMRIELVWDYSVGVEEYGVYRTEDKDGLYEKIATTTQDEYIDFDLHPETTYYYVVTQTVEGKESVYSNRASATTGSDWDCGDTISHGGRNYDTLKIGEQCWFLENIDITQNDLERDCEVERHCYDNNLVNCGTYGGLYDFSSISCGEGYEGMQGICPSGWKIPTDEDWRSLEMEMGMEEEQTKGYGFRGGEEGSKLAGRYDLWKSGVLRQSGSFASSGLNIIPGGHQPAFNLRLFYDVGEGALLWSSTRANEDEACMYYEDAYAVREISSDETAIKKDCHLGVGTAQLRCMRDYDK